MNVKKIITVYTNSIIGSTEHWIQRVDSTELLYESSDLSIVRWKDKNIVLRFVFWPLDEEDEEEEQSLWERIKEKLSISEPISKKILPSFLSEKTNLDELSDLAGSPIINLFEEEASVEEETIQYMSDVTVEEFYKHYNKCKKDKQSRDDDDDPTAA